MPPSPARHSGPVLITCWWEDRPTRAHGGRRAIRWHSVRQQLPIRSSAAGSRAPSPVPSAARPTTATRSGCRAACTRPGSPVRPLSDCQVRAAAHDRRDEPWQRLVGRQGLGACKQRLVGHPRMYQTLDRPQELGLRPLARRVGLTQPTQHQIPWCMQAQHLDSGQPAWVARPQAVEVGAASLERNPPAVSNSHDRAHAARVHPPP